MSQETKIEASRVIMRLMEQRLAELDDESLRSMLQDGRLLGSVFEQAWEHQFDRDRTDLQRGVRDVLNAAVAEEVGTDADQ